MTRRGRPLAVPGRDARLRRMGERASLRPASGLPLDAPRGRPPVIQLHDVWKIYDLGQLSVQALCGVTIRIEHGEFVAVMGSSGSGKSTLMNIVGCLDVPSSGRYLLDGTDIGEMDQDDLSDLRNRCIGFVFQSFNLVPRTSAIGNVELPLAYAGIGLPGRRRRAAAALASVGMGRRLEHQPSELSGGEQQRVAVARAIVTNPSLILADEPTGNLDSRSTEEVLEIFAQLNAEGRTVVVITHEFDVAQRAGRVITLHDGQLAGDRHGAGSAGDDTTAAVGGAAGPRAAPPTAADRPGPGGGRPW